MRAPSDSFKQALDAYVLAWQQAIARNNRQNPKQPRGFSSADRELIQRWREDPRVEEVWRAIHKAAPLLMPTDLITTILAARRSTRASINRAGLFNKELAAILPAAKERLSRLSSLPPNLGPLEAQEIRDLRRRYFGFSDHLGLPGQPKFKLSPKDQRGSRVRKLFVQIVSHDLHQRCGKWLPEQVAALTEIAFPGGKELDAEDVKKARRGTSDPKARG
jgi:hypothetical protein